MTLNANMLLGIFYRMGSALGLAKITEMEVAHWQEGAYADVRR